jgi:hypothetical protein
MDKQASNWKEIIADHIFNISKLIFKIDKKLSKLNSKKTIRL